MRSAKLGTKMLAAAAIALISAGCGGGTGGASYPPLGSTGVYNSNNGSNTGNLSNGNNNGNNSGNSASPNAVLRTASIATIHSLIPTVAGLLFYGNLPDQSAQQSRIKRSIFVPSILYAHGRATSQAQSTLQYEENLHLYYSTALVGAKYTISFFTDAAGTQPGGNAVATVPVSNQVYPNTTSVIFTITGGSFPGNGDATIVRSSAALTSLKADLHLNNGNIAAHCDLTVGTDANSKPIFNGTCSIVVGSQTITINNFNIDENFNLTSTVSVQPIGYNGTLTINGTGLTMQLSSGANVFNAVLPANDAGGKPIPDPANFELNLTYPDNTKQSIPNLFMAPVQ